MSETDADEHQPEPLRAFGDRTGDAVPNDGTDGDDAPAPQRDPGQTGEQEETLHGPPVTIDQVLGRRRHRHALLDAREPLAMRHLAARVGQPEAKCNERDDGNDDDGDFHDVMLLGGLYPRAARQVAVGRAPYRLQPRRSAARINVHVEDQVQHLLRAGRYDEAFERLLERHETQVFRMAVMMLRDHGRAEEVTQDVFLQLWRVLPRYDGRAAPSTWLYTIARNTCLSAVRAGIRRRTSLLDDVSEPAAPAVADGLDVRGLVARLPEMQRDVVTLFYLQDRSLKDVAMALDLPEGTVKSHLHRARQALASMLAGRNDE